MVRAISLTHIKSKKEGSELAASGPVVGDEIEPVIEPFPDYKKPGFVGI